MKNSSSTPRKNDELSARDEMRHRWTTFPSSASAFFRVLFLIRKARKAVSLMILLIALGDMIMFGWRCLQLFLGDNKNNDANPHRTSINVQVMEEETSDPRCTRAIDSLVHEQIRLVALDFDLTLVDLHTGGQWRGSVAALQRHVRPEFLCLMRASHARGIAVALATFSTQNDLLRHVVQNALAAQPPNQRLRHDNNNNSRHHGVRVDEERQQFHYDIPVFGGDDRVAPYWHGKQSQLVLARQYFEDKKKRDGDHDFGLSPREIVLVDDDERNIAVARTDGYRTIWYDPEHSEAEDALVLTQETRHS